MSIRERFPMTRTSVTMVVVVVLCAGGFAYNHGWFNWTESGAEHIERIEPGSRQVPKHPATNTDVAPATR
jgi:hypothetical protein